MMMMIMALHWMVWVMEAALWTEGFEKGLVDVLTLERDGGVEETTSIGRWHMSDGLLRTTSTPLSLLESPIWLLLELWDKTGNCERAEKMQRDYKEHIRNRLQWKWHIWTNTLGQWFLWPVVSLGRWFSTLFSEKKMQVLCISLIKKTPESGH